MSDPRRAESALAALEQATGELVAAMECGRPDELDRAAAAQAERFEALRRLVEEGAISRLSESLLQAQRAAIAKAAGRRDAVREELDALRTVRRPATPARRPTSARFVSQRV